MDWDKIKKELIQLSYIDNRGLFCRSTASIAYANNAQYGGCLFGVFGSLASMQTVSQEHLPRKMILAVNNDKLVVLNLKRSGSMEYFDAFDMEKFKFVDEYEKEKIQTFEFTYAVDSNKTRAFSINVNVAETERARAVAKAIMFYRTESLR